MTAFGVDIVVTTCANMFDQGTGLIIIHVYLDPVDITVTKIGDREVDHTVSSKERESTDRTIILKSLYKDVAR